MFSFGVLRDLTPSYGAALLIGTGEAWRFRWNGHKYFSKGEKMSNLIKHAETELKLSKANETLYEDLLPKAVMELIEVFSKQEHSGMSATIVISLFSKLASFEPITPLTGEDDEWEELDGGLFQNKRCSHVFKKTIDGQAYDIQGKIFRDKNGATYTSSESFIDINFPYTPKSEIVDV